MVIVVRDGGVLKNDVTLAARSLRCCKTDRILGRDK